METTTRMMLFTQKSKQTEGLSEKRSTGASWPVMNCCCARKAAVRESAPVQAPVRRGIPSGRKNDAGFATTSLGRR